MTTDEAIDALCNTQTARWGRLRREGVAALVRSARVAYRTNHEPHEIRAHVRSELKLAGFSWIAIQILLALLPYLIDLWSEDPPQ